MPKITIDLSSLGGLCPRFYGDKPLSVKSPHYRTLGKENQYAGGTANPLTRFGYLSPANATKITVTDAAGIMKTYGSTLVDYDNAKVYFLETDTSASFVRADGFTATSLTQLRYLGDKVDSTLIGTDLEMYQVNGTQQLFYSYIAGSTGNIGIYNLGTPASEPNWDDNWLSAAASGGSTLGVNRHKMIVADNGYLYVLDGNAVHKIDGTTGGGANGTATMNALLFPPFFRLTDGVDLRGKMWIGITRANTFTAQDYAISNLTGIYVWDRQSTQVNMTDFIPISGVTDVRNVFTIHGVPACFTTSHNGMNQIRIYNGNEFKVVVETGKSSYPKYSDSIWASGNMVVWQGTNGIIYAYGSIEPGMDDGLYQIGNMTDVASGDYVPGVIIGASSDGTSGTTGDFHPDYNTYPEGYYISFKIGTTLYVRKWHPYAYKIGATLQFPHPDYAYSMVKPLPKLSTVKSITYYYPSTPTGNTTDNMYVDVYFNQSNSTTRATTVFDNNDGTRGYKYFPIGQRGVNFIQLSQRWNTGNRIERCITPAFAEIDYNDTTKKL